MNKLWGWFMISFINRYRVYKEELKRIGNLFADILEDGKVTPQEWLSLGGKKGLNILRGNGK